VSGALITGAAGFIARHLAPLLRREGIGPIAGVDLRASPSALFNSWRSADLTDPGTVREAIAATRPDLVFHLVGVLGGTEAEIAASNVVTTRYLLSALHEEMPGARTVLMGSAAEYGVVPVADQPVVESFAGVPTSLYGRAKAKVTFMAITAARSGQWVCVARPFNVLGPGVPDTLVAGAIASRIRSALFGPPPRAIAVGRTDAIRDFVAVEDIADGLLRIARSGKPGECYNLCTGSGHAIREVLERLLASTGETISVEEDPGLLRGGDVDRLVGSWVKAQRHLGWRPTIPFHESLQAVWEASLPPGS
jgi:GDP-4-dehydro-6-deoxy-D-mannose reductase